MLIKQEGEAKGHSESNTNNVASYSYDHEYQTANELFDLMSKQHNLNTVDDPLTTRDLVILYENIEIGTKLLSEAKQKKTRVPNQLVETIVYNDESESEASDNYSNADLLHLCRTNDETLDLLQSHSSNDNTLCRKSSRMELPPFHNPDYDKYFLLKDPFIKEHLKNLRSSSMDFESQMLPSTLLDYLCCKRLEDNYKFNMDNIIRYVTHTIEQLKRISNGDYLTDKAKEIWREVRDDDMNTKHKSKSPKMLATCTSFPLHIVRKKTGTPSFWDDIVHSEVDLRSLSKVLEKKIVLEIPKIICGSFKLFSKQCAENLIIRCQQSDSRKNINKPKESHVDVVLQLERSESGQVMSNINSIMILEEIPKEHQEGIKTGGMLALPCTESYASNEKSTIDLKIIEISNNESSTNFSTEEDTQSKSGRSYIKDLNSISDRSDNEFIQNITDNITCTNDDKDAEEDSFNIINDDKDTEYETNYEIFEASVKKDPNDFQCEEKNDSLTEDSTSDLKEVIESQSLPPYELCRRSAFSDEFHFTIQSLEMPDTLPEESEDNVSIPLKKKSSPRVRVKSPYENKSRVTEDKKRKKLLEIKDKRDRKRNVLNDFSKITKHKFNNRSPIAPHASGSVTKLSISNKSFYNSIYGKNLELENNLSSRRQRKKCEALSDATLDEDNNKNYVKDIKLPKTNNEEYVNRCYYLDDTVDEVENTKPEGISKISIDYNETSDSLGQFERPTVIDLNECRTTELEKQLNTLDTGDPELHLDELSSKNKKSTSVEFTQELSNSLPTTYDCRESIDKIYDLMNKIENSVEIDNNFYHLDDTDLIDAQSNNKATQDSEYSSLKLQSASSNPSNESFVKLVTKSKTPKNIEPKVIISSKNENLWDENRKTKTKSYNHGSVAKPVSENPLKAISQLLRDIENVKKNKQRTTYDSKNKKTEEPQKENRVRLRFSTDNKKQFPEQNRPGPDKYIRLNANTPRGAQKVNLTPQSGRPTQKAITNDGRNNKIAKKRIDDLINEVKEARGEAVRGPTKFNSRLNTLAQPKKSYVQAHNQEYLSRHGRSLIADRLQRLAATERNSRYKQRGAGQESHTNAKPHAAFSVPPIETSRTRRSRSSSPNDKVHLKAKHMTKLNNGNGNLIPKKPAVIASCIKSQHGAETTVFPKSLPQQHTSRAHPEHLKKFHASSRFQTPSLNLEYPEIEKLHDVINTVISTIPMDYKKSEWDMKVDKNNIPLSISFDKIGSLIPEDGSCVEEEEHLRSLKHNNEQSKFDSNVKEESELLRLENALHNQNSPATFQKRLRMKNLTLTPKQSSQHVFILHSGDGSAVVLNSKISQKFKVNSSKSDIIFPLNSLSGYITKNMPMQMVTVGYTFQQYPGFGSKCKGENIVPSSQTKNIQSIMPRSYVTMSKQMQNKISDMNINMHSKEALISEIKNGSNTNFKDENDLKSTKSAINIKSKVEYANINSCSKVIKSIEEKNSIVTNNSNNDVNFSTSLDILVDLLDEIKKITTCQTQISSEQHNNKEIIDIFNNSFRNNKEIATNVNIDISTSIQNDISAFSQLNIESQELDIFNNSFRNNKDIATNVNIDISTSIQHDIFNNTFSQINIDTQEFYLRNLLKSRSNPAVVSSSKIKKSYDKELNVNIIEKEYKNKVTEIPSQIVLLSVSRSTSISNSLLGLWSKTSSHGHYSVSDYHSICTNASVDSERKFNTMRFSNMENEFVSKTLVTFDEKRQILSKPPVICKKKNCAGLKNKYTIEHNFKCSKKKQCINLNHSSLDSVMKLKRDVLVTIYSILVLTVFAALSLPQVL